jgi:hypothetical protein
VQYNAFSKAPQAPTPGPGAPPHGVMPQAAMSPPRPPLGPPPGPPLPPTMYPPRPGPDSGNPGGLRNAFTDGGNPRPIPADFGTQGPPTNAFTDDAAALVAAQQPAAMPLLPPRLPMPPGVPMTGQPLGSPQLRPGMVAMAQPYGPPAMMGHGMMGAPMMVDPRMMPAPMMAPPAMGQPGMQVPAQSAAATSGILDLNAPADLTQLRATLQDSLYPSHREWAAERLAGFNWHTNPEVVKVLLAGAKDDPAPAVRACCVRSLGRLKVNTVDVVAALEKLEKDDDPRVRNEVKQCLAEVKPGYTPSRDPEVKPASASDKPEKPQATP